MSEHLLFVYNVDATPLALLRDLHQTLTTGVTDCHLCDLSFGRLLKRPEWSAFLESLPFPVSFQLRSTFRRRHPGHEGPFPALFLVSEHGLQRILSAEAIDAAPTLETLCALVEARVRSLASPWSRAPDAITIDARYNGPPESGNGGVLAGFLAERLLGEDLDQWAEVTLRRPIPLGRPLPVESDGDRLRVLDPDADGALVAEARPGETSDAPPPFDLPAAGTGEPIRSSLPEGERTCFVCGADRAPDDGLRLEASVLGDARIAVPWRVPGSLPSDRLGVSPAVVAAALDCPGLFAFLPVERELRALLGRITLRIGARPAPGEDCWIAGWRVAKAGRKRIAGTALHAVDGRLLAEARTTWITTRPAA